MYIFNKKANRCALCYALLSTNPHTTGYSSLTRRCASRCPVASLERLISSSHKLEQLWHENEHGLINSRSICFRCCETIRQLEQVRTDMEQLDHDKQVLLKKIEHSLSKRALIIQGQRQRMNGHNNNHQVILPRSRFSIQKVCLQDMPLYEDDDTEEGEEKPRTVIKTNGYGHSSPFMPVPAPAPTTLVGAKRRKCNVAHKINLEDKVISFSKI